MIFPRITVRSSIKLVIFSKWANKVPILQQRNHWRYLTCLAPLLSSGVPSPRMMRGSTQLFACFVGPCCALRAPAVSASWTGKMRGLAPPMLLPVVLESGCSSGGLIQGLTVMEIVVKNLLIAALNFRLALHVLYK